VLGKFLKKIHAALNRDKYVLFVFQSFHTLFSHTPKKKAMEVTVVLYEQVFLKEELIVRHGSPVLPISG